MKIDKSFFLCILILICMFFGAFSSSLTFFSLSIIFVLSIMLSSLHSGNVSKCILLLLCFQNFVIGCGAHLGGNLSANLKFLTQAPFMVIAITWFISVIKDHKNNLDKNFIVYALAILLALFIDRGPLNVVLISLRNLIVFYMTYCIGKQSIRSKDDMDDFYNFSMKLSTFMLIAGIILLIGWYDLYNLIGINEVYIAKGSNISYGAMNARFYTDIFHIDFKRMGSLYYEPVNLAYYYAAMFVFSLFYKKKDILKISKINVAINGIGLILCFGKGGYLIAFFTVGIVYVSKFIKKSIKGVKTKSVMKFVTCLCVIFLSVLLTKYYTVIGGSVKPHFWGLINTFNSVLTKPIGYGLGTGGNMYALFNNSTTNWLSSGGESGLMVIMYQLGIQGIIAFIICFLGTSKNIRHLDNDFFLACKILPFSLLFISLLQENTYTPQCITLYMLIIGAANNLSLSCEEDLK